MIKQNNIINYNKNLIYYGNRLNKKKYRNNIKD